MNNLFYFDRFELFDDQECLFDGVFWTYRDLLKKITEASAFLENIHLERGSVVALVGDYNLHSIALLFALIERRAIIVPVSKEAGIESHQLYCTIAQVDVLIETFSDEFGKCIWQKNVGPKNGLILRLQERGSTGIIVFSSGSTGKPKAAIHDLEPLLQKFVSVKTPKRTINFFVFDHWGGLNTLFHIMASGGCVFALRDRKPATVCALIEECRIQVLPTTPSFLNLLLISGEYKNSDLASLELVTYGSEPMYDYTLKEFSRVLPGVRFKQTYGLIELGVMSSQSKASDSLLVRLGGEGYDWRIVNNMLEIKAHSSMLGYLNAPSPFTPDGYFQTNDIVIIEGDFLRILGRSSDIINVGGEKVYPAEIESVVERVPNVLQAVVSGSAHPILGQVVIAKVHLEHFEDPQQFARRMRNFCLKYLEPFKIPVKISITENSLIGPRHKKNRSQNSL